MGGSYAEVDLDNTSVGSNARVGVSPNVGRTPLVRVSRETGFPPGDARSRRNPRSCPWLAHWRDFSLIPLIQFNRMNDYENAKSDYPINASPGRVFVD